ncbi:MAG: NADH:flavin oxidoreductase [Deltaproteobacteria bacterium]|nr:NADH:flavin oxidoreductase [Deltaproteobacteria bacterium]
MVSPFEKAVIGRIPLRNRFVRSATWEGMCGEDGAPTERLVALYEALVEGGVGLIITGYAYVRPEGKQTPGKMGIYDDSLVTALTALTRRVHGRGGRILMQLVHAGGQANRNSSGLSPVAPSAVSLPQYAEIPAELTREEIADIVAAFGRAAGRAKDAGFDGVQLHGAHGYLISQFLSPLANRRTDEYGGPFRNRSRFLSEVVRAVRETVGKEYPVWIKLNGDDFHPGGFSLEEACQVARMLEEEGIDAIEVSGGTPASGDKTPARSRIDAPEKEAYHRALARAIKSQVRIPVGLVGGLRTPSVLDGILQAGEADFFSMARPLIREPGLVKRWSSGDRSGANCVSCNGCFVPGLKEGGIYCVAEKKGG